MGDSGANKVPKSLAGTVLDKTTERRALLKGGALASLASFFSFGPLSLRAAAKRPLVRIIEERLVPVPPALRPGIESATRHFASLGWHVPRHFATYHKVAVGDREVEWISYNVASEAVNGRKATIHAGVSKDTGPMVGGSITTWSDLRVTRLEAFEYGSGLFRKQAVTELGAVGEVSTTIAPTAFHGADRYAALAPGLERINRIQDALDHGTEACDCGCACDWQSRFPVYCHLYCIVVCGTLALICPPCGLACEVVCYVGCTFTVPCEMFCGLCGCGSMTSTECDQCCASC